MFIHGGDIKHFQKIYDKNPLDFSVNVNPLGIHDAVKAAYLESITLCDRYPDPTCDELREKIAIKFGCSPDHVFVGAGAEDIFYRLAYTMRCQRALIPIPTYSDYAAALGAAGSQTVFYQLTQQNDFALTKDFNSALTNNIDAVFLCHPNNPTGRVINPALLKCILQACAKEDIRAIIDESFLMFQKNEEELSAFSFMDNRAVLVRSMTKLFAIPGIRLGFCICRDTSFVEALYSAGPCWHVSAAAQACGLAALDCQQEVIRKTQQLIAQERSFLEPALTSLGLRVFTGSTNFILFYSEIFDLCRKLEEKNIVIRDCNSFEGLGTGYYRIAVRGRAENEQLMEAFRSIVKGN